MRTIESTLIKIHPIVENALKSDVDSEGNILKTGKRLNVLIQKSWL